MLDALFGPDVNWMLPLAAATVATVLAYVIAEAAARGVRALLAPFSSNIDATLQAPVVRGPIRITRIVVLLAALAILLAPALRLAGAPITVGLEASFLRDWFFGPGVRILIIGLVTYLAVRVIAAAANRLEEDVSHDTATVDAVERAKRARTVSRLVQNALTTIVLSLAFLMLLTECNVDVARGSSAWPWGLAPRPSSRTSSPASS